MAVYQTLIRIDMDPAKPVPELIAAIQVMIQYNPIHEVEILKGLQDTINKRLHQLEGGKQNG